MNKRLPLIFHQAKKWLFYVLFALLPFNIRHIFNYEQIQSIEGFREHISWSLSMIDVVFLLIVVIYFIDWLYNRQSTISSCKEKLKIFFSSLSKKPILLFSIVLLLSIVASSHKSISIYNSLRLLEAAVLYLIAKDLMASSKKVKRQSIIILFLSGVFQSLLALMQFVVQRSLGLKLLGESVIAPNLLGVSKFEFAGEKFIRAYGTFPHPNILGAFLLLALAAGVWLFMKKNNGQKILGNVGLITGSSLIIVGMFLSYSRSVLFVLIIFFITLLFTHKDFIVLLYKQYCKKLRVHSVLQGAIGLIIIFSFLFLFYNLIVPRLCITNCTNDESIVLRFVYNKAAYATINDYPAFGVGAGNFVPHLDENSSLGLQSWERQPAHNLYLLITSELGLLGLIAFLFVLASQISAKHIFKKKLLTNPFVVIFFLFLVLGLVDHYFWTTPQAQMVFWLSLAFFASSSRIKR